MTLHTKQGKKIVVMKEGERKKQEPWSLLVFYWTSFSITGETHLEIIGI